MFRKLKNRWQEAGDTRWDDYFYKPPWWLRVKRFVKPDRTEEQRFRDGWEKWNEERHERGDL
jgi:hypothetical protein